MLSQKRTKPVDKKGKRGAEMRKMTQRKGELDIGIFKWKHDMSSQPQIIEETKLEALF